MRHLLVSATLLLTAWVIHRMARKIREEEFEPEEKRLKDRMKLWGKRT